MYSVGSRTRLAHFTQSGIQCFSNDIKSWYAHTHTLKSNALVLVSDSLCRHIILCYSLLKTKNVKNKKTVFLNCISHVFNISWFCVRDGQASECFLRTQCVKNVLLYCFTWTESYIGHSLSAHHKHCSSQLKKHLQYE